MLASGGQIDLGLCPITLSSPTHLIDSSDTGTNKNMPNTFSSLIDTPVEVSYRYLPLLQVRAN